MSIPVPTEPGLYDDIDEEAYHRDPNSVSVSGLKTILRSPAHYLWEREHPKTSTAFDLGSVAHAIILGKGAQYVAIDGNRNANAVKEQIAEAKSAGLVVLKSEQLDAAQRMADAVSRHRLASQLLSAGRAEVSAYMVDEPTGCLVRGRFDWVNPDATVDLKTALSADPDVFRTAAARYGYHMQNAMYVDLRDANGETGKPFVFVVVENTPPHPVTVIEFDAPSIARGRELNRRALDIYATCRATDEWPGYTRDTTTALVGIPSWAMRDAVTEIYDLGESA